MNYIHQYVYDKRNQPVAVIAAVVHPVENDSVFLGWSRCNKSLGDRFDRNLGIKIAVDRALARGGNTFIPDSLQEDFNYMINRANRYFKDKKIFA